VLKPLDRHPVGVVRAGAEGALWRVWAPKSQRVALVTYPPEGRVRTEMTPEDRGYFTHRQTPVPEGLRYAFELADGREYPDPASRWQPEGVHRPSAVFFPESYAWADDAWHGVRREDLVIYELHIGTFTPEGTFEAVIPRLPQLAELGITALELMPVGQFPGSRNWGYDGVHPYAAQNSYGGPRALQRLIDAAHHAGLAVLIDVIYNHLGPEGNYLPLFGPYFTDCYKTPWGNAINFDGPDSDGVRDYVIENACMWVRDFHADGLRLDAVHSIYDRSAWHILAELAAAVAEETADAGRIVHVIAESDFNDVRLVRSPREGGYGLDAVWSDDFHHSVHALLTGQRDGYYRDFGRPEHLVKALNNVYVYDCCYSPHRRRRHGSRVGATDRTRFVTCIQNHDQVGNCKRGDRFGLILPPAAQRLAASLLLLTPHIPLVFMGDEYGETRPFPFFCSFDDEALVTAVRQGRCDDAAAMAFEAGMELLDPQSSETFAAAVLTWQWPEGSLAAGIRQLYRDLLAARRHWPALRDRRHTAASLWQDMVRHMPGTTVQPGGDSILIVQRGMEVPLLAVANLGGQPLAFPGVSFGRCDTQYFSSEDVRYGGTRTPEEPLDKLRAYELLCFGPRDGEHPA
jgi:maltooligosyltrehalose trehalohydrolase